MAINQNEYQNAMAEDLTTGKPMPKVSIQGNAQGAASVTPSDSTDLTKKPTKGVYVGVSGDLKVNMQDGTTVTFTGLAAGVIHPLAVNRIYATGTTATGIIAVY